MDLLNWAPKYTGLDGFQRGIKETANWFISLKIWQNILIAVTSSDGCQPETDTYIAMQPMKSLVLESMSYTFQI